MDNFYINRKSSMHHIVSYVFVASRRVGSRRLPTIKIAAFDEACYDAITNMGIISAIKLKK